MGDRGVKVGSQQNIEGAELASNGGEMQKSAIDIAHRNWVRALLDVGFDRIEAEKIAKMKAQAGASHERREMEKGQSPRRRAFG